MANLQHILADKSAPPSHPLGYLTTQTRDVWNSIREELLAAGKRLVAFDNVVSSLVVVVVVVVERTD